MSLVLSTLAVAYILGQKLPPKLTPYQLSPGIFVSLPASPTRMEIDEKVGKMWMVPLSDDTLITLTVLSFDTKGQSLDQSLAATLAGFMVGSKATQIDQKDLLLSGWPGLEFKGKSKENIVAWGQEYMVDNRVLQVVCSTQKPANGFSGVKTIFDSIRLPGGGPQKVAGPDFQPFSFEGVPGSVLLPGKPKIEKLPVKDNPYHLTVTRAVAEYGNRTFLAAYMDLPAEAADSTQPDAVVEALDKESQSFVSGLGGKSLSRKSSTLDGNPLVTTEFSLGEGKGYGRVDAVYKDFRLYVYAVVFPTYLKGSEDVKRFFASVSLVPK